MFFAIIITLRAIKCKMVTELKTLKGGLNDVGDYWVKHDGWMNDGDGDGNVGSSNHWLVRIFSLSLSLLLS